MLHDPVRRSGRKKGRSSLAAHALCATKIRIRHNSSSRQNRCGDVLWKLSLGTGCGQVDGAIAGRQPHASAGTRRGAAVSPLSTGRVAARPRRTSRHGRGIAVSTASRKDRNRHAAFPNEMRRDRPSPSGQNRGGDVLWKLSFGTGCGQADGAIAGRQPHASAGTRRGAAVSPASPGRAVARPRRTSRHGRGIAVSTASRRDRNRTQSGAKQQAPVVIKP
jgi:hypothetical protein